MLRIAVVVLWFGAGEIFIPLIWEYLGIIQKKVEKYRKREWRLGSPPWSAVLVTLPQISEEKSELMDEQKMLISIKNGRWSQKKSNLFFLRLKDQIESLQV